MSEFEEGSMWWKVERAGLAALREVMGAYTAPDGYLSVAVIGDPERTLKVVLDAIRPIVDHQFMEWEKRSR